MKGTVVNISGRECRLYKDSNDISGRECRLYKDSNAEFLLVQPIDEHDLEVLDQEVEIIKKLSEKPFSLVAFMIKDWNKELTPWPAPPVFGKIHFGNGATDTLNFIVSQLLPLVQEEIPHVILGGYSLAGLFALWASYQTEKFEGIVAASPSIWFPKWIEYATDNKPFIRKLNELLAEQIGNTILEWNPGNHFIDSEKRTAKGFAWVMNN